MPLARLPTTKSPPVVVASIASESVTTVLPSFRDTARIVRSTQSPAAGVDGLTPAF